MEVEEGAASVFEAYELGDPHEQRGVLRVAERVPIGAFFPLAYRLQMQLEQLPFSMALFRSERIHGAGDRQLTPGVLFHGNTGPFARDCDEHHEDERRDTKCVVHVSSVESGLDSRVKAATVGGVNLKIGQVAERAGVSVDTVRYYERVGILPAAPRRPSGYRLFDEATVERIKLVKQLQDLSLTLEEVDAMLVAVADDTASCARESSRIEMALRRTEERIAALEEVRGKLRGALRRCGRGECDLVERARKVAPRGTAAKRRPSSPLRK
jgi:DNA-binding transcriptional MerR regulator